MAKPHISMLHELSARVEEQLHQFMDEEEYEAPEKKKRNPLTRAAMAGGAVVGGLAARDLYERNKGALKQGAKDAAFKGMRSTAGVMNKAGNKLEKVGRKASKAGESRILGMKPGGAALEKTGGLATGAAGVLKKKGNLLRKKSMKFFNADLAATMLRIEGKLHQFGA
jgi:hypothetical protein